MKSIRVIALTLLIATFAFSINAWAQMEKAQVKVFLKHTEPRALAYMSHTGPYSEIPAHYAEFLAWIDYEGATIAGPPREVYLVHPGPDGSGDAATFRTEIQFPVRAEG